MARTPSRNRNAAKLVSSEPKDPKDILLSLVPVDGSLITNNKLKQDYEKQLKSLGILIDDNSFYDVRGELIQSGVLGKGKGQGGSTRRIAVQATEELPSEAAPDEYASESNLYFPFHDWIKSRRFLDDYRVNQDMFISEITAQQGSKTTGGKWTRPDLTLISVRNFEFIPGKSIEVMTFEIKPNKMINIDGVFEAASHGAFANRSFLAIHTKPNAVPSLLLERVERECERFGVGLILFEDPANADTFEVRVDARFNRPDPNDVNDFIKLQISKDNQDKLRTRVS